MEVNTDPKKIEEVLTRGVVEVIDKDHLKKRMLAGETLRVKLGIDPTSPDLHIGHGSTIKKLREFQDLGHQIVLIIGDGTALIGDTSDKVTGRETLSREDIDKNKKEYLDQASKILNMDKVEVRHNGDWINKFDTGKWIDLASLFTLQQLIERENYAERIKNGDPVGLHEALYPLMQGYDSVEIESDVEIGGTDQLFNLLAGRKIQKNHDQEEQDIITLQLLTGTDGRKMSKSWGNVIMVREAPEEKYGKMMRLPDQLIPIYMESATLIPMERVKKVSEALENSDDNPIEYKKELAFAVVQLYDGDVAAEKAQEHFENTVQNNELPENIPTIEIPAGEMDIKEFFSLLIKSNLIKSKSEGMRLLKEGAIYVDGESLSETEKINLSKDTNIKVGKRRFLNIKVK
jgi:tyrosyl-tRNA synthetase